MGQEVPVNLIPESEMNTEAINYRTKKKKKTEAIDVSRDNQICTKLRLSLLVPSIKSQTGDSSIKS